VRKPRLVVLRGRPTSGKSTAWHSLRERKELKDWVFVDFCKMKETLGKEKGKVALFKELKDTMAFGENIMIEEMSKETLGKYVGGDIVKFGYEIIVFQFTVSTETAYKRDVQRAKDKWHPLMGKKLVKELHDMHDERIDKDGILVDCDGLGKDEVVELILKKLG
jgi:predicted kinase